MKRGEIYYADLNPSIGDEIKNIRPVLIVSNNINNKHIKYELSQNNELIVVLKVG
jgi:mRNA-degrading endonuclease toxin of MazEF toxin-antitoxin module